jgi:hypothetical protein
MRLCISTLLLLDDRIGFDFFCLPYMKRNNAPKHAQTASKGGQCSSRRRVAVARFVDLEYIIC